MQTYTLKVIDIKKETEDTVTLCFKQPSLKKIKYRAGQYLTLIFRINGRRYIRPYSFSSAPGVDGNLEVTVKRVPNGIVSNHINDVVRVNDLIEVMPPMGDFVLPEEIHYRSVFLWGAGSGITPLLSIGKFLIHHNPSISVKLIYGNRSKENVIFNDTINRLCIENSKNFEATHFYSQLSVDDSLPDVVQGRISREQAIQILHQNGFEQSIHFICGPVGLKESVRNALREMRISDSDIFSEDFELVKDPKDFESIETRNVSLSFQGIKTKLEVVKGRSILEVALDAGLELPYSCQTGNCSTCKGVLKSGTLRMIGLKGEREDLKANEFLLCCSYPLTNDVYIEI